MNWPTLRALFADALYQVLDNMVFRILAIVAFALVAATFLVGFREQEIVLLFGLQRIPYESVPDWMLEAARADEGNPRQATIQFIQSVFVNFFAGSIGILIAIAATAFFVPQMLEKGAADALFSKPIGRLALLLAKYASGLLFVALLGAFLVLGMHSGFMLRSGYSDPGFLWGAVTLTYTFALVYPVVMLVGILTRSTVASILLGLLFFMGNGCVAQQGWMLKEQLVWAWERGDLDELLGESGADPAVTTTEMEDQPEERRIPFGYRALIVFADVVHYPLPKTTDADFLADMLRKRLEGTLPEFVDPESGLSLSELPPGCEPADLEHPLPELDLAPSDSELRVLYAFSRGRAEGREPADVFLLRRPRRELPSSFPSRPARPETTVDAAADLSSRLRSRAGVAVEVEGRDRIRGAGARAVQWQRQDAGGPRRALTMHISRGEWIYVLHLEVGSTGDQAKDVEGLRALADPFEVASTEDDPGMWYAGRFGWTAPLKYNAFFSIGSSLAFAIAMLALAWWRLSRIDF